MFEPRIVAGDSPEVDALLARESGSGFDPDFWVVEIETDSPQDISRSRLPSDETLSPFCRVHAPACRDAGGPGGGVDRQRLKLGFADFLIGPPPCFDLVVAFLRVA